MTPTTTPSAEERCTMLMGMICSEKYNLDAQEAFILHHIREAETAAAQAATLAGERELDQVMSERDDAQEAMSQAYYLVTGKSPEWSNLFGYLQALEEIKDSCDVLRQEVIRARSEGEGKPT